MQKENSRGPRRSNGEGTKPRKRKDGRYQSNYTKWTVNGPKRDSVYGRTFTECLTNLHKALAENRAGALGFDSGTATVGEFIRGWLEDSVRGTVREVTYNQYELHFRVHIEPGLGHLRLSKLTTAKVLAWLKAKNEAGTGAAILKKSFGLLKRALDQAVAWNLIPRNPAEGVKSPRYSSPEIRHFSLADVPRFLEAVRGDDYEALFLIAATGGPRESEILALKWEDVAQDCSYVRIDEAIVVLPGGREEFNAPKSNAGRRSVPLTAMAQGALRDHRRRFLERRMETGERGDWSKELVFPSPRFPHMAYRGRSVLRRLYRILDRAGLPRVTFHGLRHTFATLMFADNAHPKVVQGILGHSRASLTLDLYSHHIPALQKDAVGRLDELLRPAAEVGPE